MKNKLFSKKLIQVAAGSAILVLTLYFLFSPSFQNTATHHSKTEVPPSGEVLLKSSAEKANLAGTEHNKFFADDVQTQELSHKEVEEYGDNPEHLGIAENHPNESSLELPSNDDDNREDIEAVEEKTRQEAEESYAQLNRRFDTALEDLFANDSSVRLEAIQELLITAGDLGVPDKALAALDEMVGEEPDERVAEMAQKAIQELLRLSGKIPDTTSPSALISDYLNQAEKMRSASLDDTQHFVPDSSEEESQAESAYQKENAPLLTDEQIASVEAYINKIEKTALEDEDAGERGLAISELTIFRTVDSSLKTLQQAAASDPSSENRYNAIEALTNIAHDGYLERNEIIPILESATRDTHKSVSDLAEKSLRSFIN